MRHRVNPHGTQKVIDRHLTDDGRPMMFEHPRGLQRLPHTINDQTGRYDRVFSSNFLEAAIWNRSFDSTCSFGKGHHFQRMPN